MKKSQIIILGSLCGAEAIGLVRAINGDANGIGSCMIVTALMAWCTLFIWPIKLLEKRTARSVKAVFLRKTESVRNAAIFSKWDFRRETDRVY